MKSHATAWQRRGSRAAAALALILLVAAPASAAAEGVVVGVAAPVVVPIGLSTHAGAGITPTFGWSLGKRLTLGVTTGFVYYYEGDHNERTVPVLASASWTFPTESILPYLALRAGYTYAVGSERSPHWMTVMGGAGVLVPTKWDFAVDVGFDVLVADVRGNSRDPVGLLVKIGLAYWTR